MHCFGESKMVHLLWKNVWWLLKKLNIELLLDPAILLLGIHTKELKARTQITYLYTNVHRSIIHNSQKIETTQMSTGK